MVVAESQTRPFFRRIKPELSPARKQSTDFIWNTYQTFVASQWMTAAEIERRQVNAFRLLARHCQRHVPWYRRLFAEHKIDPRRIDSIAAIRRLPLLPRPTLQKHAAELQARSLPPGMFHTSQVSTSGTTGTPVKVQQTNIVTLLWYSCLLRDMEWAGFDPCGSFATIRNFHFVDDGEAHSRDKSRPVWGPPLGDLVETGSSAALSVDVDYRRQWEWLRDVDPICLLSTAGNLEGLAQSMERLGGPLPRLKVLQSFSESVSDDARRRIETAFGVPVWNVYTCMEAGYLTSPCPVHPERFHIHAENVLLEILNADGEPCSPGETGRVVLTPLMNFANPLLRYEIGDLATAGGECPCGRGLPTLERIEGKTRPSFELPNGGQKSTSVLASSLASIKAISQYQVEQRAIDDIVARVVPRDEWNSDLTQQVIDKLTDFFEHPIQPTVEVCERIPLSSAGKLRSFMTMPAGRTNADTSE